MDHRRRTGEGQYIDFSQGEASIQLHRPSAVLDYTVNGRIAERCGNDDVVHAPHGTYRAAGDDRWIAIAVTDDAAWARLCDEMGRPDLATLQVGERRDRRRELDGVVEAWTAERPAAETAEWLVSLGIAAHQVQNTVEAFADPQLRFRRHFQQVPHATMGQTWVEGSRYRFSRTPVSAGVPPTLGEHNWEVLTEVLGYDDDRVADLAAEGIFD